MHKFLPSIEIQPWPLNVGIDDIEDEDVNLLYHVIVSQANLKMLFLVEQRDTSIEGVNRRYEVLRCESVSLHGIDQRDKYMEAVDNVPIGSDCSIVNEIFESILKPYGLRLIKVNFHDFVFFESDNEGTSFIFEDAIIYDKLKDLINIKSVRMMKNQKLQ